MMERPRSAGRRRYKILRTALVVLSLVLLAIVLIEVGWVLRGYLVLAQANREAARFSARPPLPPDSSPISSALVATFTAQSLAGRLPVDLTGSDPNATQIYTRFVVDTGY
jgi:Flp pilus assembly protein TadG